MKRAHIGIVAACSVWLAALAPASAGAWTLAQGHWQSFSGVTASEASTAFASNGRAVVPATLSKWMSQTAFQYGVTNALTVFASFDSVKAVAQVDTPAPIHTSSNSFETGARLLLTGRYGQLSVQTSYKTAGAFDLSVSAHHDSGRQIELRVLYGTNFSLFGVNGFADLQAAQRWITRPRPNETPIDLTIGLWVAPQTLLMAQSFNLISSGDATKPYGHYRSHKLEFSVVERLSRHWSLQIGAFASPAGQNALVERGFSVSLWTQH